MIVRVKWLVYIPIMEYSMRMSQFVDEFHILLSKSSQIQKKDYSIYIKVQKKKLSIQSHLYTHINTGPDFKRGTSEVLVMLYLYFWMWLHECFHYYKFTKQYIYGLLHFPVCMLHFNKNSPKKLERKDVITYKGPRIRWLISSTMRARKQGYGTFNISRKKKSQPGILYHSIFNEWRQNTDIFKTKKTRFTTNRPSIQ